MYNYKLKIQYDGAKYHGWQIQQNAITVQEVITNALETLTREKISLIGAGRTDTGVHALGQTANFRCEQPLDIYRFQYSLNSMLPFEVSVRRNDRSTGTVSRTLRCRTPGILVFYS